MKKLSKIIKYQIIYCSIFSLLIWALCLPLVCYSYEPVQTVIITKEDITLAHPTKEEVNFNKKELHAIEVMEERHFTRKFPEFSDNERLRNLEFELLGRVWEYTKTKERIERLKIASSNAMIVGMALPPSLSSKRIAKRMRNTQIQMRERDNAGLLDGFLRLMNPDLYEQYRQKADKFFEYEY